MCALCTHAEGQLSVCWGTPGFCPWDTGWDEGENWGAGAGCWRMPGKQRCPSTGKGTGGPEGTGIPFKGGTGKTQESYSRDTRGLN